MNSNDYSDLRSNSRRLRMWLRLLLILTLTITCACGGGDSDADAVTDLSGELSFNHQENDAGVTKVAPDGMTLVTSGTFVQGCDSSFTMYFCSTNTQPSRDALVPDFYIDITEVTNQAFAQFQTIRQNECRPGLCYNQKDEAEEEDEATAWDTFLITEEVWTAQTGYEDYPASLVTWFGANSYCTWAGKHLCSETEWEKAARGPDKRNHPWGDTIPTCEQVVFDNGAGPGCGAGQPSPVATKPGGQSPYGAFDMVGNVWEWVQDDGHDTYNGAPTDGKPWLENPRNETRMYRGGDYLDGDDGGFDVTAYRREVGDPNIGLGFRCCMAIISE
jgi:formylglycine-generating enzyme required for sulfatase activity